MAYFRSHWTWTTDLNATRSRVDGWVKDKSASIPGFVGVWFGEDDLDEDDFHFVAIETTDRTAFAPQVHPAINDLTALLSEMQGREVRFADTEDVSYLESASFDEAGTKGHGDAWFTTDRADEAADIIRRWQDHHLVNTPAFERTWLVRGISDPRIHSLAVQFTDIESLVTIGEPAFDDIVNQLQPLLLGPTERRRGGGGLESDET